MQDQTSAVVDIDLMTPAEVARALRISPATLARWARDGDIEVVELPGGGRRYHRSTVTGILAGPTGAPPDAA